MLTTIILLLIAIIMFIVARNKRTRTAAVLDALQHNLHTDSLGIDKRLNSNFKVSFKVILRETLWTCLTRDEDRF